ncbi:hypothetical protein Tco_0635633 [Tanacetum coccineum]
MDEPRNITKKENIDVDGKKKARMHGKSLNDALTSEVALSCEPPCYFDDLDYFKDFEKEFPTIAYNEALTSKLDFLTEPTVSPQHIDEFNLKDETPLSECDREEQNVLYFNDLFLLNVIYPDDLSDKDNDDYKIDIKQPSGDIICLSWMIQTSLWRNTTDSKKKRLEDKDNSFTNLETEYPAIVFDGGSDAAFSREPTVSPLDNNEIDFNISFDESDDEDYMVVFNENSFSCKIISVNNLKTYSENENDKVNMPASPSPEPTFGYIDDSDFFKYFENELSAIAYNDLKSKSDPLIEPSVNMAPLPHHDLRHPWLRYQVDGYDEGITLRDRLSMVYTRDDGHALFTSHAWRRLFEVRAPLVREFMLDIFSTCRMSDTEMGLDVADTLCFQLGGARRRMTWR